MTPLEAKVNNYLKDEACFLLILRSQFLGLEYGEGWLLLIGVAGYSFLVAYTARRSLFFSELT